MHVRILVASGRGSRLCFFFLFSKRWYQQKWYRDIYIYICLWNCVDVSWIASLLHLLFLLLLSCSPVWTTGKLAFTTTSTSSSSASSSSSWSPRALNCQHPDFLCVYLSLSSVEWNSWETFQQTKKQKQCHLSFHFGKKHDSGLRHGVLPQWRGEGSEADQRRDREAAPPG